MKTNIYDINAKNIGEITLPTSIFGAKISKTLIAQAIRVYLANQRTSYAKTKHRGNVHGTTKKVWAQKGTGRARHGSRKAPIFVGGGIALGPRGEQNYSLKLSKTMKRAAVRAVLSQFAAEKRIIVIDKISTLTPKTKEAIKLIAGLRSENELLNKSKKLAIVTSKSDHNVKRAFGNLQGSNLLSLKSLNAYDLSNQNFLIFSKKAISKLTK